MTSKTINASKDQIAKQVENLRQLARNTTIYTVIKHTSKSNMTSVIDMYYIEDNQPYCVWIADSKGFYPVRNDEIRGYTLSGGNYSKEHELVYRLGIYLHDDGYYFNHRPM